MVGFPHSEIHGSKPAHGSPWLIAACHVLHRLSTPRHPPNALKTLDRSHYHHAPTAVQQVNTLKWYLRSVGCQMPQRANNSLKINFFSVQIHPTNTGGCMRVNAYHVTDGQLLTDHMAVHDKPHTGHISSLQCQTSQTRNGLGISYLDGRWWRQTGSNRRPTACKAVALPTELCPLKRAGANHSAA